MIALAKLILREKIREGRVEFKSFARELHLSLPSKYTHVASRAYDTLVSEGFIEEVNTGTEWKDRATEKALSLLGQHTHALARLKIPSNRQTKSHEEIIQAYNERRERERAIINDTTKRKRSYGQGRSVQVKVSFSEEEISTIESLASLGYGHEGTRSAVLRKAIFDICAMLSKKNSEDINNLPQLMTLKSKDDEAKNEYNIDKKTFKNSLHGRQENVFILDDQRDVKEVLSKAVSLKEESLIICLAKNADERQKINDKVDILLEGLALMFDGKILKADKDVTTYMVRPN